MLLVSIALISIVLCSDASATDFIHRCPDYTMRILSQNDSITSNIQLQTEEAIGVEGHFSGLTPLSYNLNITFPSHFHYEVLTEIFAHVSVATSRLMVHVPGIISSYSFVFTLKGASEMEFQTENCIKRTTFLSKQEVLVIDLAGELRRDTLCVLKFDGFNSQVYNNETGQGPKGLQTFVEDGSAAVVTAFFMRYAHSVFPCMDHPALKAQFNLCLTFPSDLTVVSSMPRLGFSGGPTKRGTEKICFLSTPMISPHSLAFALMKNYQEHNIFDSKTAVYAPSATAGWMAWMVKQGDLALEHIRQLTGVAYPLPKIQFLIVDNPPPSTHGSFGLCILNATLMGSSQQYIGNLAELYHSIVHQWLGGMVTIRNWNEICLQEGLAHILEWMFEEENAPGAFIDEIQEANRIGFGQSHKSLMNLVNDTDRIPVECASVAPVIFYDATQQLEPGFLRTFVRRLVSKYKFGIAGLKEWSDIMADVVPSRPLTLATNVINWFENSEPISVFLQDMVTNYVITVEDNSARMLKFRTVLALVYCSSDKDPHAVIISFYGTSISFSKQTDWCVFDPDGLTLTYKIYDVLIYKRVLSAVGGDTFRHLTDRRLEKFADDFCLALLEDLFVPRNSYEEITWMDVFQLVTKRLKGNLVCKCCITEPRFRDSTCGSGVNQKCNNLQLVKSVFAGSSD